MASANRHWEQDRDATIYIGNLDERITDSLVFELFLQSGRIANVHLPKDRVTQSHQGYGFVEFLSEEDADYSSRVMNGVRLFGKPIRVNKASADKSKSVEVGAELFVGNLDPMVDERMLYETFGRFGTLIAQPKIARDESMLSKGYGFISYADFGASDDAITNMNGQYLMNKEISVQYAYKKDGKGERHGDEAERMLAAQAKAHGVQPTPATIPVGGALFAGPPPQVPAGFGQPSTPQMPQAPTNGYNRAPPPGAPPRAPPPSTPLSAPPSDLPARPPPSQAGYGGPQGYVPGFGQMQQPPQGPPQGMPQGMPQGFGGPPPGMPQGGMPQGFSQPPQGFPPQGMPPQMQMPAGFGPPQQGQPPMPFAPPPGYRGPQAGPNTGQGGGGGGMGGFQGYGVRK